VGCLAFVPEKLCADTCGLRQQERATSRALSPVSIDTSTTSIYLSAEYLHVHVVATLITTHASPRTAGSVSEVERRVSVGDLLASKFSPHPLPSSPSTATAACHRFTQDLQLEAPRRLRLDTEVVVVNRHDLAVCAPTCEQNHARWRHDLATPRYGTTVTLPSHAKHHWRSAAEPEGPGENPRSGSCHRWEAALEEPRPLVSPPWTPCAACMANRPPLKAPAAYQ